MDFLGIGFSELLFILIIAMMVFGPRRLPEMAAKAGKFVRDMRGMSQGLMTEWQRELGVAARMEELQQARQDIEAIKDELNQTKQDLTNAQKDVTEEAKEVEKTLASTTKEPAVSRSKSAAASKAPAVDETSEGAPSESAPDQEITDIDFTSTGQPDLDKSKGKPVVEGKESDEATPAPIEADPGPHETASDVLASAEKSAEAASVEKEVMHGSNGAASSVSAQHGDEAESVPAVVDQAAVDQGQQNVETDAASLASSAEPVPEQKPEPAIETEKVAAENPAAEPLPEIKPPSPNSTSDRSIGGDPDHSGHEAPSSATQPPKINKADKLSDNTADSEPARTDDAVSVSSAKSKETLNE